MSKYRITQYDLEELQYCANVFRARGLSNARAKFLDDLIKRIKEKKNE